jgi:hypothetical protein
MGLALPQRVIFVMTTPTPSLVWPMAAPLSCCARRSVGADGRRWLAPVLRPGRAITGHHGAFKRARNSCKL